MGEKRDELEARLKASINKIEELDYLDSPEEQIRKIFKNDKIELRNAAVAAAAEQLGITIDGGLNKQFFNDNVNKQLEGSGVKLRDVFDRTKTKKDLEKFSLDRINTQLPDGLSLKSLSKKGVTGAVSRYAKKEAGRIVSEGLADLVLDDDVSVLAQIEAYNDGRSNQGSSGDDPTNAERQARFRSENSYSWR
jgi:hypothetical protein